MSGGPLSQIDALDRAVMAATVEGGSERLLERDREALARGFESLRAGREGSARYVLSAASRRTAPFIGAEQAIARLIEAADKAGVGHEQALHAALVGVLQATTPKL